MQAAAGVGSLGWWAGLSPRGDRGETRGVGRGNGASINGAIQRGKPCSTAASPPQGSPMVKHHQADCVAQLEPPP